MFQILVVEDDRNLNKAVCQNLNRNGYQAIGCYQAADAYEELRNNMIDLIISDIMMPQIDGYELARAVRAINPNIPILFMTAKDDFLSKQRGFEAGIDDYMVKPVHFDEMMWRIRALLRRANIADEKKLILGTFVMDADTMTIVIDGNQVPATVREFNILYKLLSYPNHAFSRAQLLDEFWGSDSDTSMRAVDVYVTRLREKFSACEEFKILTVYGLGYKAVIQ